MQTLTTAELRKHILAICETPRELTVLDEAGFGAAPNDPWQQWPCDTDGGEAWYQATTNTMIEFGLQGEPLLYDRPAYVVRNEHDGKLGNYVE